MNRSSASSAKSPPSLESDDCTESIHLNNQSSPNVASIEHTTTGTGLNSFISHNSTTISTYEYDLQIAIQKMVDKVMQNGTPDQCLRCVESLNRREEAAKHEEQATKREQEKTEQAAKHEEQATKREQEKTEQVKKREEQATKREQLKTERASTHEEKATVREQEKTEQLRLQLQISKQNCTNPHKKSQSDRDREALGGKTVLKRHCFLYNLFHSSHKTVPTYDYDLKPPAYTV